MVAIDFGWWDKYHFVYHTWPNYKFVHLLPSRNEQFYGQNKSNFHDSWTNGFIYKPIITSGSKISFYFQAFFLNTSKPQQTPTKLSPWPMYLQTQNSPNSLITLVRVNPHCEADIISYKTQKTSWNSIQYSSSYDQISGAQKHT